MKVALSKHTPTHTLNTHTHTHPHTYPHTSRYTNIQIPRYTHERIHLYAQHTHINTVTLRHIKANFEIDNTTGFLTTLQSSKLA